MTNENWEEYDKAAKWCALRGIAGNVGDALPALMSSAVHNEISQNPDEFKVRIRECAYAIARERAEVQS